MGILQGGLHYTTLQGELHSTAAQLNNKCWTDSAVPPQSQTTKAGKMAGKAKAKAAGKMHRKMTAVQPFKKWFELRLTPNSPSTLPRWPYPG